MRQIFNVILFNFKLEKLVYPNVKFESVSNLEELQQALDLKNNNLVLVREADGESVIAQVKNAVDVAILVDQATAQTVREWSAAGANYIWPEQGWIESLRSEYQIEYSSVPKEVSKEVRAIDPLVEFNRTIVIAVGSVYPGLGSTHTSLLLASFLSRQASSVSVWEAGTNQSFDYLDYVLNGDINSSRVRFDHNNITLFKGKVTYQQVRAVDSFSFLILDLGYIGGENTENNNLFINADIPVLLGSGSLWRAREILLHCQENQHYSQDRWRIVLPMGTEQSEDLLRDLLLGRHIFSMPEHKDPFTSQEETDEVLESILHSVLPRRKKKRRFKIF